MFACETSALRTSPAVNIKLFVSISFVSLPDILISLKIGIGCPVLSTMVNVTVVAWFASSPINIDSMIAKSKSPPVGAEYIV